LFRRLFLDKLLTAHKAGELQFFNNHAPLADGPGEVGIQIAREACKG
jgi:hypothetical protein